MQEQVDNKYKKHELRTHIYNRPDMYIGTIQPHTLDTYIVDNNNKIIKKQITYIPGLFKIFDEALVNAIDHSVRTRNELAEGKSETIIVKNIKVLINKATGYIEIFNDGNGIEIIKHSEYQLWIPELIFGELLTSSNYNDDVVRTIGGVNGLGIKLTNIYSKEFTIETIDHVNKKIYTQTFRDNLTIKEAPVIKSCQKKPYTKITFLPDYEKFGLKEMTDDIYDLFKRRVYDVSACTDANVNVYINDIKIPVKDFEKYVDLYLDTKTIQPRYYEKVNDRWEIVVAVNQTGNFEQMSFVNGINTIRGGRHIDYITNSIIKKLTDMTLAKKKKTLRPQLIRDNIFVFVKCVIDNPSFDSQTKETLTTLFTKFGSKCELSDKFYDKLYKSGIIETALSANELVEQKKLTRTDGKKINKIIVPKLDDANYAGTKDSNKCTLILTEGDSAKSTAIAGLSVIGRDYYGVFPLRGKIMNVKDVTYQKISDNNEITALKKILGLEQNKDYTNNISSLRYGKIMIMTDQDHDGSHIKGLLFNVFETLWSSLYKYNGFLTSLLTPIIKAINKDTREVIPFYNMSDYEKWNEELRNKNQWKIKYYKGLGTSTDEEAKEYFKNMKKITYKHTENSDEFINLAFNKKRADDRKEWLGKYDKNNVLDYTEEEVSFETFINKDLIHFSNRNLERAIPNIMDGLKESTRKILYACFKRKLYTNEIKVAQLAGNVSEVTAYHHGETSLQEAIIGMAQIFVGTNNINLLSPNGQHGCLSPDTKILMWDSSIKNAENIIVGDKLVGDDGTIRNVLKTTSGIDMMYEINMNNGEKYIVNSKHILTLKYKSNKKIYFKKSSKIWYVEYYDNINNKIVSKTFSTNESTTKNHYNSSKLSKEEAYDKILNYVNNLKIPDVYDIKLEDFLKLSKSQQNKFYCIKNSEYIKWNKKPVPIDPYILGCWLGDGNSNGSGITSIDDEILKSFVIYLDSISCELTHDKNGKNHENCHFTIRKKNSGFLTAIGSENHSSENCLGCQTSKHIYNICNWKYDNKFTINKEKFKGETINGSKRNDMNPWKELLKKYNLFNNKHIPKDYILNDKETRLQLLAGFIDTDGCVKYNKGIPIIEITQNKRLREHIIKSLQLIANSLGYKTHISEYNINKKTKKGEDIIQSVLLISGNNIDEIPTRLHRKKIIFTKQRINDPYILGFTIKELGYNKYCGWSIDNNERFLLGDFTITHNSRIQGGEDASSPRYIYTLLSKLSRLIFKEEDNDILNYLNEDGLSIEPEYYIPIIPMILVNGAIGIGTGYSTNIPQFNPEDIINLYLNIINDIKTNIGSILNDNDIEECFNLIREKDINEIKPYYLGFKGEIYKNEKGTYSSKGIYKWLDNTTIEITELPVGTWTENYKEFLEELITKNNKYLKSFESHYTTKNVKFILKINDNLRNELEEKILTEFNLTSNKNLSLNNLHLFTTKGNIKKYLNINEILKEWSYTRIYKYQERKNKQLEKMELEYLILSAKIKFIIDVIENNISIMNVKLKDIEKQLEERNYYKYENSYDYLLRMHISQLTAEKKDELEKDVIKLKTDIDELKETSIINIWENELKLLLDEWIKHKNDILEDYNNDLKGEIKNTKKYNPRKK